MLSKKNRKGGQKWKSDKIGRMTPYRGRDMQGLKFVTIGKSTSVHFGMLLTNAQS